MIDARHDLAAGCGIGAELVGDHAPRAAALLMEKAFQQPLGGLGVAVSLNDFVENIAVLIDGAPEKMFLAVL